MLNVTSNLDNGASGTLRSAVAVANASGTPDTIDILTTQTIVLTKGALSLSHSMTIEATAGTATISGGGKSGVFSCISSSGGIYLTNLNVTDGKATYGGGIYDFGGLIDLDNCTVSGNSATEGGGIFLTGGPYPGSAGGGHGSMSATSCTFSDNSATYGGGIYIGADANEARIITSTLSDNSATYGGGMYIALGTGSATSFIGSIVSDNSATSTGGGIDNRSVYAVNVEGDRFFGNSPNNITGPYGGPIVT